MNDMNRSPAKPAMLGLLCLLVIGCDDGVNRSYANRFEAEEDHLFEKGWLPEIIPQSASQIRMRNDLDLNVSEGEFSFDPSDHDAFVKELERSPSHDKNGRTGYTYEKSWVFWIHSEKNHCKYRMKLSR